LRRWRAMVFAVGWWSHRFQIRNYELRIRKNENDCSVRSLLAVASPQRRNSNSFHSALRQRTLQPAPLIGQLGSRFSALIEGQRCRSQECFGERKQTRSPRRIRPVADETPAHRRARLRPTLRFWRCGGFCGFAGFRRCAACGCRTTGKIFIRGCEDIVLDK